MKRTAQDVFDTVVLHLRKQGCKSLKNDESCCYRGENGTKCAVGCLISDDDYSYRMEKHSIRFLSKSFLSCKWMYEFYDLLFELQAVHDNEPIDFWEEQFVYIAKEFDLILKEKDNV
jgi:hypothetical protein